jgi:hypothetical protein
VKVLVGDLGEFIACLSTGAFQNDFCHQISAHSKASRGKGGFEDVEQWKFLRSK